MRAKCSSKIICFRPARVRLQGNEGIIYGVASNESTAWLREVHQLFKKGIWNLLLNLKYQGLREECRSPIDRDIRETTYYTRKWSSGNRGPFYFVYVCICTDDFRASAPQFLRVPTYFFLIN